MKKWILLIALLVAQCVQAASVNYTGNELLAKCERGGASQALCRGYIMGVLDASKDDKTWEGTPYCKPGSLTGGQLQKIVVKHFNERPADIHFTARSLVQNAFLEAFPCE